MWLTRTRYEALVDAEARTKALQMEVDYLQQRNGALEGQIVTERRRAENAVDALLLSNSAPPITPQQPLPPDPVMFDDDPAELEKLMKEYKMDPAGTLMREGVGDAGDANV